MLMLMATLTYARIENYRSFSILQAQFERYMNTTERDYLNKKNKDSYDDTIASKKDQQKDEKEEAIKADSKLDFTLFVNQAKRAGQYTQYENIRLVAKNLITYLYSNQPFFMQALEQKPDLIDQLLNAIVEAADALPEEKKIKKPKDLANLDLRDPVLNEVFYKMLRGTDVKKPKKGEEEENVWVDYLPMNGYLKLLKYISLSGKTKIRVYLASPQLLIAIFRDPVVVQEIIDERKRFYRELKRDKSLQPQIFQQEFMRFLINRDPGISPDLLNFEISKTDPGKYE